MICPGAPAVKPPYKDTFFGSQERLPRSDTNLTFHLGKSKFFSMFGKHVQLPTIQTDFPITMLGHASSHWPMECWDGDCWLSSPEFPPWGRLNGEFSGGFNMLNRKPQKKDADHWGYPNSILMFYGWTQLADIETQKGIDSLPKPWTFSFHREAVDQDLGHRTEDCREKSDLSEICREVSGFKETQTPLDRWNLTKHIGLEVQIASLSL